jgi:hypothetical protein
LWYRIYRKIEFLPGQVRERERGREGRGKEGKREGKEGKRERGKEDGRRSFCVI